MPHKSYYLAPDGNLRRDLDQGDIVSALGSGEGVLWVDISGTDDTDGRFLEDVFHFHHLAVEDCLTSTIHPPKIDDFGNYLFIVIHGIDHAAESDVVETAELGIFLGRHFVVSTHMLPLYGIEAARQLVEMNSSVMKRGSDFLAHALADSLIDNVLPSVDKMSETAGDIEDEILVAPRQSSLQSILLLKRSALRVHRVMTVQRDVFNRLSRGEFPIVTAEARIFYRDVYDHVVRIEDLSLMVQDRADNALSTYLSSVANRQNETMKTLTAVATIFLPLTLLAGIYGMNFHYIPELGWHWGYFVVVGVMAIAITTMIWRFWVSGWLASQRSRAGKLISFAVDPRKLVGYSTQHKGAQHTNP